MWQVSFGKCAFCLSEGMMIQSHGQCLCFKCKAEWPRDMVRCEDEASDC